jgi:hypothetical protein
VPINQFALIDLKKLATHIIDKHHNPTPPQDEPAKKSLRQKLFGIKPKKPEVTEDTLNDYKISIIVASDGIVGGHDENPL